MQDNTPHFREKFPHYIGINKSEEKEMCQFLGLENSRQLFEHLPSNILFKTFTDLPAGKSNHEIQIAMEKLADKNKMVLSLLGAGVTQLKPSNIIGDICGIRGLTTAYTPYQPEKSQGTLISLWIYQSILSALTGMEAVNASMYDRSTAIFEAIKTASRLNKKYTALVCENIDPRDKEVITSLAKYTNTNVIFVPFLEKTSLTDLTKLNQIISEKSDEISCVVFPQVNYFGNLEQVDQLTNLCEENKIKSIAVIDPLFLANDGLKKPANFGNNGVDFITGEVQHFAIDNNFGGPGLGLFGCRYNNKDKMSIRQTPGRYVGKGSDRFDQEAFLMVLSTREQHIRREKATSNICSNQSFLATLAGACYLTLGSSGHDKVFNKIQKITSNWTNLFLSYSEFSLTFESNTALNTITLNFKSKSYSIEEFIKLALDQGIELGEKNDQSLIFSFSDKLVDSDLNKLETFLSKHCKKSESYSPLSFTLAKSDKRIEAAQIETFSEKETIDYYKNLGELNISPDDGIYPLGSCTMKYNPYINDWAAGLPGFTTSHPVSDESIVQGNLEVLFEIQEWFKKITGLPGVATQIVAGAHGELAGLKMFQAYFAHKGELEQRKFMIIPRSAHGTNPATATVAGFTDKKTGASQILWLDSLPSGEINLAQVTEYIAQYGNQIAGVMVTNPNTAGIFETKFKDMADQIHEIGGLVYMDGANMNAIAGIVNLNDLGVDAVHNNLHKTWSIPHGGGGPGDGIVAVSEKLIDFIPGFLVKSKNNEKGEPIFYKEKPKHSIGMLHRHHGNFAHKVRALTYLYALGSDGISRMSEIAVLSSRYLVKRLSSEPMLPQEANVTPRMHEFILTLSETNFTNISKTAGIPKASIIGLIGKLFLDYGLHAPTVSFPEQFGLMIEPTESFTKDELDRFSDVVLELLNFAVENPQVLTTVPHFSPMAKIDELKANRNLVVSQESLSELPSLPQDRVSYNDIRNLTPNEISGLILKHHLQANNSSVSNGSQNPSEGSLRV
ncbi:aminomethyl-transferring glycine dehydrogenase subunit GcvPB [Bacteriovoracaceae bacterium]|nr:aminomethyl-transferring glycine dehydrogenase subunit GcvPB [Bacteriovoracaceae bacterium]